MGEATVLLDHKKNRFSKRKRAKKKAPGKLTKTEQLVWDGSEWREETKGKEKGEVVVFLRRIKRYRFPGATTERPNKKKGGFRKGEETGVSRVRGRRLICPKAPVEPK